MQIDKIGFIDSLRISEHEKAVLKAMVGELVNDEDAERINASFDKLVGENYTLSTENERLKKENTDTIEQLKKFSENNFQ